MKDTKQAKVLLEASGRDLTALAGMADQVVFAEEIFGFHVQQAAEKLLKAWLALLGDMYPRTHNLEVLLDLVIQRDPSARQFLPLVDYTPFAGRLRYGSEDPDIHPLDRVAAIEQVGALLERVQRDLSDDCGGGI